MLKDHEYKIFGRNKGRKKNQLADPKLFNSFELDLKKEIKRNKKIILDIGSGNGENCLLLSKKNSSALIIACDIYVDGNVNLFNQIYDNNIKNIRFYKNNVLRFFDECNIKSCLNEIWILFPDPWPKARHHKRRLIKNNFFKKAHYFLQKKGKIFIATDSISYLNSIIYSLYDIKMLFKWENDIPKNWEYETHELPKTKFYKKAENSCRSSFFIEISKI